MHPHSGVPANSAPNGSFAFSFLPFVSLRVSELLFFFLLFRVVSYRERGQLLQIPGRKFSEVQILRLKNKGRSLLLMEIDGRN